MENPNSEMYVVCQDFHGTQQRPARMFIAHHVVFLERCMYVCKYVMYIAVFCRRCHLASRLRVYGTRLSYYCTLVFDLRVVCLSGSLRECCMREWQCLDPNEGRMQRQRANPRQVNSLDVADYFMYVRNERKF